MLKHWRREWAMDSYGILQLGMRLKPVATVASLGGRGVFAAFFWISSSSAQTRPLPSPIPPPTPRFPLPEQLPDLPTIEAPSDPQDNNLPGSNAFKVIVQEFRILGSTVFSDEQLATVTQSYLNRPLSFAQLLEVRSAITQLYLDQGYITSGAFLPADQFVDRGIVTIQVVEGQLEDIQIIGNRRLQARYIRDRIQRSVTEPLNVNQLLDALRYLQLNPLIQNISAELAASDLPGLNTLIVNLAEAKSRDVFITLDNHRSENIGSFQRQIQAEELNLTGRGDRAQLTYSNTDGSNEIDVSYRLPINAKDGTVELDFNQFWSRIIAEPFEELNLSGQARSYGLKYRQPLITQPQREFAIGASLQRIESQTRFDGVPTPLSAGADDQGQTRITRLNLFQEWVNRDRQQVVAVRSDFGIGLDLGATNNPIPPDGDFFQWQGQAQWLRQFRPDTQLLVRTNLQIANQRLLPIVQLGLGGGNSIRGYPQDFLLVDNGLSTTIEGQLPILRTRDRRGLLQVTPFVDYGYGWNWNRRPIEGSNHLLATGVGLQWQWSDRLQAKLDWGIPLISTANRESGFDQSRIFFSLEGRLF